MAAYVILSLFAAYGVLCALWSLFGFLLPGRRGACTVCLCTDGSSEATVVDRHRWLSGMGFAQGPLILVDCGLSPERQCFLHRRGSDVILCTPDELFTILKQEREYLDRTRT
jgi:hypothetical protein